jgi:hypothetical protein
MASDNFNRVRQESFKAESLPWLIAASCTLAGPFKCRVTLRSVRATNDCCLRKTLKHQPALSTS